MRINLFLFFLFISFIIVAFNSGGIERIGGTQLNGNGCVCHTTIESPNVHVWVEGPDTMIAGQSALYKMYMFGGPAIAGGYNVAVRFGLLNLADTISLLIDNELTQKIPLPFPSISDTISWHFFYTAPDSVEMDTIYSVGISTNWDSIPDDRDQWAYGPKFPVRILENTVPVEFTSFTGEPSDTKVILNWITATEKNNRGFEVERKLFNSQFSVNDNKFEAIGFIKGKGTSSAQSLYSFTDNEKLKGDIQYRLKQIDFNGSFTYSKIISVYSQNLLNDFSLGQNHPNPFNPTTGINWQAKVSGWQTLKVYDVIGNEVVTLVDEFRPAGNYEVEFNPGSNIHKLASGVYFYCLKIGQTSQTKKMIYLR